MQETLPPPELVQLIANQSTRPSSVELDALRDKLINRYGDSMVAILFYGSCMRSGNALEGLVDLYIIVDDYYKAYNKRLPAYCNRLLPPNVYFIEAPSSKQMVRCKYAVVSLDDFKAGTSKDWFHSYLWARFAQPAGLLYARDTQAALAIHTCQAQAVFTFLKRVMPRLPSRFDARQLWQGGLALTYKAELRAETAARAIDLYKRYAPEFDALTRTAAPIIGYDVDIDATSSPPRLLVRIPFHQRALSRAQWLVRVVQGKLLSLLRLMKAAFTFQGGIDYVVWKLERHSGERITVTPRLRRHPLIFVWPLMWRLYRRGIFR